MDLTNSNRPETKQFDYIVVGISPATETSESADYDIASTRTGMGAVMAAKALLRRFPHQRDLKIWCDGVEETIAWHNVDHTDAGDDQLADTCESISNVLDACTAALRTIKSVQGCARHLSSAEKERIAKELLGDIRREADELKANRSTSGPDLGEFVDLLMKAEAAAIAETADVVTP